MERNEKVWAWSQTGTRIHAYTEDGPYENHRRALCRGNITKPKVSPFRSEAEIRDGSGNGTWFCYRCLTKFNAAVDRAEASMEPAGERHDLGYVAPQSEHTPEQPAAESMREFSRVLAGEKKENEDMGRRKTTGPLSPTQHRIMHLLVQGHEHAEIAKAVHLSRTMVSEHVRSVVAKMGVTNSAAAVGRYAKWQILGELIWETERMLVGDPVGEAEEHADDVLRAQIDTLSQRRSELVP